MLRSTLDVSISPPASTVFGNVTIDPEKEMRLIHEQRIRAEGLTFNGAGIIVDANGAEYDAIQIDDHLFYTRYATYLDITDQMTNQIIPATRIASKENGYQRETLYRAPGGNFFKMIERVNTSGPDIVPVSYALADGTVRSICPGDLVAGPLSRFCRQWEKTRPLRLCLTVVADGGHAKLFDDNGLMFINARLSDD
jgi:hypothetical protein